MSDFRFAVMGAAMIANKFCDAVRRIDGATVCAIGSRSIERAEEFAKKNQIPSFYGDYETMLIQEKPDCVYIAATTDLHFPLSMLCVKHKIPVLCEKAMFTNTKDASTLFALAKENGVFTMEALWSKFLPTIQTAKERIASGAIGQPVLLNVSIGFCADPNPLHRYFNPALGGGTAYDLTVYCYELSEYLLSNNAGDMSLQVRWSDTGVDASENILTTIGSSIVSMQSSLEATVNEELVVSGTKGKLCIPKPHFASEFLLYDEKQNLIEHFIDAQSDNGFVYEAKEAMRCIRQGKMQSEIADHAATLRCAALFDLINETKP